MMPARFYLKAQQLAPKNGKPYNQLAVTAINSVSWSMWTCGVCLCDLCVFLSSSIVDWTLFTTT